MPVEMRTPFGSGSAQVPDDLVEQYRANGWALIESESEPEPEAKPKARATRSTTRK